MKAPFPWWGGKRKVAPQVWAALGDVDNFVEPFAGSLAVLLARPTWHAGSTETVNDADQYLANFWRALALDPEQVAHYADWPVNEADLFARHLWLVNEGKQRMAAGMADDPDWYDAKIAGWWVWGICAWIGSGWCSGTGPHTYAADGAGVDEQLPHLGNPGQGVNRKRPHLGNAGRGVSKARPNLTTTPGVHRKELNGISSQLPFIGNGGRGGHRAHNESLYAYMHELAARLRHVRVCCGDWSRVVTNGALSHGGTVGIFLDPPYSDKAERTDNLYATDSLMVAHDVRAWAIANGENPRYRIVLAGYIDEHDGEMPPTWRRMAWKANKAYGSSTSAGSKNDTNRSKEMLWMSPFCLNAQPQLFALEAL